MKLRVALPALARGPSPALLLASLAGWGLLQALDREAQALPLCLAYPSPAAAANLAIITAFGVGPIILVVLSWAAMVVAMTAPLLAQPFAQLRLRSLVRRRGRAAALFAVAYLMVWMIALPALLLASAALAMLAGNTGLPALVIAAAIGAGWQAAPLRQSALNRCHRPPRLSAFGAAADFDCIRFGLTHGFWCAATCAPLMLLPLAAPALHLPLMLALSAALALERIAPARPPRWTLRILPGQAVAAMLLRSMRWRARRAAA